MVADTGSVIDKDAVRDVLQRLLSRTGFSDGELGVEQATNRICGLQRAPRNLEEVALTVHCEYCGRTAGNPCRDKSRRQGQDKAHPSRIQRAIEGASW